MRRKLIKTAAMTMIFLVSAALFEGLCSLWTWFQFGTVSVTELNAATTGTHDGSGDAHRDSILETWYPHPFLDHVVRESRTRQPNNIGLLDANMPMRRDPAKFTILISGGSVAQWFVHESGIEKLLNEQYQFDRPVVVLNGSCGGWKQPQQTTMLSMYGDCIDAVVTLDGFNEAKFLQGRHERLGFPGKGSFATLNPMGQGSYASVGAAWQAQQLRELSSRYNSRALFLFTSFLRRKIEASVDETPSQSIESMFALPEDWADADCAAYNLAQYQKYIRLMHVMANDLGIKEAHFIQPCPAIGKKLTEDERRHAGDLEYADTYRNMERELLKLNEQAIPVVSLLDCFDQTTETVYVDNIHNNPAGKQIMAARLARDLAKLWNISTR